MPTGEIKMLRCVRCKRMQSCVICNKSFENITKYIRKTCSKICEKKLKRLNQIGELNSYWKGNKIQYGGLHNFITSHIPKPDSCQKCRKVTKYLDAANKSGQYTREITDWEYLCRSCHMKSDGRINNLYKGITEKHHRDSRTGKFMEVEI